MCASARILKYIVKFCIQVSLIFFHWVNSKYKGVICKYDFILLKTSCAAREERNWAIVIKILGTQSEIYFIESPLNQNTN